MWITGALAQQNGRNAPTELERSAFCPRGDLSALPTDQQRVFAQSLAIVLGSCPGGIGLSTALLVLPCGWAIAGLVGVDVADAPT
jgi:hypothetical protein